MDAKDTKEVKESIKGSRATVVEIIGKTGMQSKLNIKAQEEVSLKSKSNWLMIKKELLSEMLWVQSERETLLN